MPKCVSKFDQQLLGWKMQQRDMSRQDLDSCPAGAAKEIRRNYISVRGGARFG